MPPHDEIEPSQIRKADLLQISLVDLSPDQTLHLLDDYFPETFINRRDEVLDVLIQEHIYTKYWEHKYHARFFAEALASAVNRLSAEGHPICDPEIENSDHPHFFIQWRLQLPASLSSQSVLESIESAFDLVWTRANAILENSDSVLILGKDTGDGLDRLKAIEAILKSLGYLVYIIKEQPDRPGETIIQKVLRIALSSKFVFVENTEASGHLYEIPHVGKAAEAVMVFLQERGRGATWMFEDGYYRHNNWHKVEYDPAELAEAVQSGCEWAEGFVRRFQAHQVKVLPWLAPPGP